MRRPITTPYGYIYVTICLVNNKKYIGQRHWETPDKFDSYIGSGKAFMNAVRKYGKPQFTKKIVDWANNKAELDELEKLWIDRFNAVDSSEYYNIQAGGGSWSAGQVSGSNNPFYGKHHTEETKQKIRDNLPDQSGEKNPNYGHKWSEEKKQEQSQKLKGAMVGEKNPNYGHHWSAQQRKSQSMKLKGKYTGELSHMYGKHMSEHSKMRLSSSLRAFYKEHPWTEDRRALQSVLTSGSNNPMYSKGYKLQGSNNGMYGKHHTDSARAKMSKNHANVSGYNNPCYGSKHPLSKQITVLNCDTGEITKYQSLAECCRLLYLNKGTVTSHIKTGEPHKGYIFSYTTKE